MSRRLPGQMNLTLAAFYGEKPRILTDLIQWCQTTIASQIPGSFRPYEIGQVHATVVGLEGKRSGDTILNENSGKPEDGKGMDLARMLADLQTSELLPFRVRIGGFRLSEDYRFKSAGLHPYIRSFGIQSSEIALAIGWPEKDQQFPNTLDSIRRQFNKRGILHKYHKEEDDVDNDFFFVLGKVDPLAESTVTYGALSELIRVQMTGIEPVRIDVRTEDLSLVAYVNDELPLATSIKFSLESAEAHIDDIIDLYQEAT